MGDSVFQGASGYNQVYVQNLNVDSLNFDGSHRSGDVNGYHGPERIIANMLSAEKENDFAKLSMEADKAYSDKTVEELRCIVEEIVKGKIDSPQKKEAFLDRLKTFTFNIGNSIVAGLALQAVKNLVFKS